MMVLGLSLSPLSQSTVCLPNPSSLPLAFNFSLASDTTCQTHKFHLKPHSPPHQPLSVTAELQFSLLAWLSQTHRLFLPASLFTGIRAYEQLGQRAFGPAGKVVVAIIICLHNVGGEIVGKVN